MKPAIQLVTYVHLLGNFSGFEDELAGQHEKPIYFLNVTMDSPKLASFLGRSIVERSVNMLRENAALQQVQRDDSISSIQDDT